jgi:chloride channel protein, CIC family
MTTSPTPLIQRLRLRENHIFFALTILIAVFAGLSAVLFTLAIKGTTFLLFGVSPSILRYILVPTLMSLVTGFLLAKFFPEARGSGVPQTEAAYHLRQGDIPGRVAFGKFLTGVLCIGSGHSMGREGPSVQIGAGLASSIGKWFHLSPERAQSLVPVAAAAALSAAFNTPVAAVIFALEEIIGDMNAALVGSTVVASVAAVIVERSILGNSPIFQVPQYHLVDPAELIAYAVLGVVGGIVSLAFSKGLLWLRGLFQRLPARTRVIQPAIGGLIIGVMLIFFPQVMGVGYEYVNQGLNGGLLLKTMALLCVVKLVATIISYASGNAGGIFAPSLYLGAMAGGVIGTLMHRFAPFPTGDTGAYALVGMGTLFAGIIRAPMTSVFMIFELTQDYQVFVPLMIANMISFAISKHYQPVSLYHALLQQDNVHMPATGARIPSGTWRAADVMTREFTMVPPTSSMAEALEALERSGLELLLVGADGMYEGLVSRSELEEAIRSGMTDTTISRLITTDSAHAHPDHALDLVLERLDKNQGLLPVVSRGHVREVLGIVTPQTIYQHLQRSWKPQSTGAVVNEDSSHS